MDAMTHALKKKIGGVHITVEPIKDEMPEDASHLVGQDPKLDLESDIDKENMDMAPDVKSHGHEMDMLHKMIGPEEGDPMRKPMTLGERAKGKMKERMASIKKEKGLKGKY
jgi:hypothetical protein